MHKESNDDVKYLKSKYRKMVKIILEDKSYVNYITFLVDILSDAFNKNEELELCENCLTYETYPRNIERFKYHMLALELYMAFPEQRGFTAITGVLDLNEPRDGIVEETQENINDYIEEFGEELTRE